MVDHNEHTPKDSTPSEGEPRPSVADPDVSSHTDGHDDAPGLGGYLGRAGAGARTLARAIISRSAAAGNQVRRPIGTTLATLGGMLPSVTGRGAGGIGLFRGTINSSNDAANAPARPDRRAPSSLVWLRPVSPVTESAESFSQPIEKESIKGQLGQPRKHSGRDGRPIGRAAATRIRRRPETRSLRDVPTYVESPATMRTEHRISGNLSQPFVSKSKWAPTEYESTKDRPPASLANFLERNVDEPKEHRLRPVSVSRHDDSRPETPLRRTAANPTNTNTSHEEGRTKDAPKPTSLNQVSVIHRDVAEAPVPSDKTSESRDRRPRIYQRSKRMISKGRDAILRKRKASEPTIQDGAGQSDAVKIESPVSKAQTSSGNAKSEKTERISRSPLSEPQGERKDRSTGPIQRDPIAAATTASDDRNAKAPLREQPSSSVGAGNSGPAPEDIGFSPSSAVDVEPVQGKAKGIVDRAKELVFRKPSNEMSVASDSVESTLLADAVQRRPDSKPASDLNRPAKRISRSPLSEPQGERKDRSTGPIQGEPIGKRATTNDARIVNAPPPGQPSSSVGAGNSGPVPEKTSVGSSSTVEVTPVRGKAKGIVNRARELVFRKPSNEMSVASDSVESTLLADAVQRRRDDKPASDLKRSVNKRTVLTRAREKLARKPKTSTADQQVPQEAAGSAEINGKPTEAAGEKSAPPVRRTLDAGSTMPSSMSGSPAGEPGISSDKVDRTQAGLLSQPMMEHRAVRHEPGHTAVPTEPSSVAKPADRHEPLRRSSKDTGADENAPGGKETARDERPNVAARSVGQVFHQAEDASPTAQVPEPGNEGRSLISQAARGIMLGAQRLVFRSAPSTSAETPALASAPAKASPAKKDAQPPDTGRRQADAPRESMPASVLQRAKGATSPQKSIVHRKQAGDAPPGGAVDHASASRAPSGEPSADRSRTRPIGSTRADALSSMTRANSRLGALRRVVSRKASKGPARSEMNIISPRPKGSNKASPETARQGNLAHSATELLHRKIADVPTESVSQGEALGQATPRSRLVRSSERADVKSEDGTDVLRSDGDGKSGRPTVRPRNALNHTPQVQRRTQPASTNGPLQRATADAPHIGVAQTSRASRAADTKAPVVQRTSTAKEPASFQGRAVHRTPMVGVSATTQNGAISRVLEQPDQTAAAELDEMEEPLYKKFTPRDIEFLSSKMFTYIKRRLNDDRERHGRPGFSMWS